METINATMMSAKCPECSKEFAFMWEDLSEEQQCMRGFFCPECGKFISFTEGGSQ